jgi:hypothetical protein
VDIVGAHTNAQKVSQLLRGQSLRATLRALLDTKIEKKGLPLFAEILTNFNSENRN